jgi:hypothetical protein
MAVPYTFANTPVGTYLQLINLDANFSYLTNTPTLLGLTVANTLTVNGASIFSGSALFNDISINGAITIHGNTFNPTGVTGTGDIVLNTNPVLVTPNLGVPSFLDLTNATNLPIASVIGIQPSLYPFLATPNSVNLRAAVTDETGTGALVFADGPTLIAPNLGTPASGNLSNCTGFPASGITGVLSIANGGTGAATAPLALNNLLPTQTSNASEFLQTDGSGNVVWTAGIQNIINIAALRALPVVANQNVNVGGYYADGDGGGGEFYGVTGGSYTDNGGTIIVPGGGTGTSAWLRPDTNVVSVLWFGAQPGPIDNTPFIGAAAAYLNTIGGGIIEIPLIGDWRMNWVCLYNNIILQGVGGKGIYDVNCIRPFSLASAPLTIGNSSSTIVRYCAIKNLHISGTDGSTAGTYQSAHNAPQAIHLVGNAISFTATDCVFFNGLKTVSIEPNNGYPVTGCRFNGCDIRNDINDNNLACGIYNIYTDSLAYSTDNKFFQTKLNGPSTGYAALATDVLLEVFDSYWDIKPDHGVALTGSAGIVCYDLNLDPGALGAVVIQWSDPSSDPCRFITGNLYLGGQLFRNSGGTYPFPTYANQFSYQGRYSQPYLGPLVFLTQDTDPYSQTVFLYRTTTAAGAPVKLAGADFHIAENEYVFKELHVTQDIFALNKINVYGGNAAQAALIAANSVGGGLYLGALGANQDIRLVPSGTGFTQIQSGPVVSGTDNTQALGLSGNRWSDAYVTNLHPGAGSVVWTSGAGNPNGVVTAPVGSLYTNTTGAANTTLYVKESGVGNVGWVAK